MAFDLPAHVKPRFNPDSPPDDVGANPARWDYWAPDASGHECADFLLGEAIARDCLGDDDRAITRVMLSYMLATMRDKGAWGDIEAGLISLLGRKAQYGAKPDVDAATPQELQPVDRTGFQLGMADAIADMRWGLIDPVSRLLPARIMDRIGRAVVTKEYSAEFAGYATAIIASATACGEH